MSRFNTNKPTSKTTNLAGGEAHKQSSKFEIVSVLLTSFVQDQFYRKAEDGLKRFKELIQSEPNKEFIAKAALYARNVFGMRSISHVAAAELAHLVRGESWTRPFYANVVRRPDDATEILSYYLAAYGKPIPEALKHGIAQGLSKFSAYQLAKYRGEGKGLKLRDVVNLVHVRPNANNEQAFKDLMSGDLKSFDTWETKLTLAGSDAAQKKTAWSGLVLEKQLGYFALLRNLRNIANDAPEVLDEALKQLTDEQAIKNPRNLVMPFRYLTAMGELSANKNIVVALSDALEVSLSNVPKYEGETLVALDVSGSMSGKPVRIGSVFAAVLAKANLADIILFEGDARYADFNPRDSVMTIANGIKTPGGSTNFNAIFNRANKKYDRVIILSDMQAWVGYNTPKAAFSNYCQKYDANPFVYCFDLAGHGTMQFPENRICQLAGFNEAILDVMPLLEKDKNALISEIEKTEIRRTVRESTEERSNIEV